MDNTELAKLALMLLGPLEYHHRRTLRAIAIELKQMDAEHWSVGEMLERACIALDAMGISPPNISLQPTR